MRRDARAGGAAGEAAGRAQRGSHRRRSFWDQAGHDLRQPVQSLQLLAQVFARQAGSEPLRQGAEHMRRVVDDLAWMHEALLRLARLESGDTAPEPRPVAIGELAGEIERELGGIARERGVELRLGALRAAPEADPAWLGLVLRGLVLLAIGHSEGREVRIGARDGRDAVSVTVDFEAPGIAERLGGSVFVNAAEPGAAEGKARAILGPGYLGCLCGLLGYRFELGPARAGGQRFRLTIPRAPPSG